MTGEIPDWEAIDDALPDHVTLAAVGPDDPTGALLPGEEALVPAGVSRRRRDDAIKGRTAARAALARLGVDPAPIDRGPHREPRWPPGIVGSITHASGWAAAVVARASSCAGLGIDLESPASAFPGLVDEVASPGERATILAIDAEGRDRASLELFSAKESIYKAFFPHVGRYFGFDAAEVRGLGSSDVEARLLQPLHPDYPPDRWFPVGTDATTAMIVTWVVLDPGP